MKKLIVLIAFIGFASGALAEASKESVEEMMSIMKVKERYLKAVNSVTAQQIQSLKAQNNPLAEKLAKEFKDGSMSWEAVKPELAKIYADSLTDAELKEICAFYKTTIGQQMINDPAAFSQKMKKPEFEKEFSEEDKLALIKFNQQGLMKKVVAKKAEIQAKIRQIGIERMTKVIQQMQLEALGKQIKTK